jgi:hypothetical protein
MAEDSDDDDGATDKSKRKSDFDAVRNKIAGPTHKGRAVVFFRDKRGMSAALALNGFVLRGRPLVVSKRRTSAKTGEKAEAKRKEVKDARKRKREAESTDLVMPVDIDVETQQGRQESEVSIAPLHNAFI